jgi:lipopolysaccharide/colanic/teichoic acid biosynthesis glycosyltransferase
LDELPQLINVLAGHMALLGPRPETPAYVDLTDERWREVLRARPGLAGPTQVLVADWEMQFVASADHADAYGAVIVPLKLAIDLWYVQKASPWIDLLVVTALAQRFIGPPTRTALYARVAAEVPAAVLLDAHHGR